MHDTQHISRIAESTQNWTQNDLIELYFFLLWRAAHALGQKSQKKKHLVMRVMCVRIFLAQFKIVEIRIW